MAETDSRILEYLEEGLFLYGVGKVQESIVRWRKVLELDPRNERAMDYIESAGGDVSQYRQKAGLPSKTAVPINTATATVTAPSPRAPEVDHITAVSGQQLPSEPANPVPPASSPLDIGAFLEATGTPSPAQRRATPAGPTSGPMPWQAAPTGAVPAAAPRATPMPSPTNATTVPSAPTPMAAPMPAPAAPAPAPAAPPPNPRQQLITQAGTFYQTRQFETALEILERVAREYPPVDDALRQYIDATRNALYEVLKAEWPRPDVIPEVRMNPAQVMQLKLSPEAGFIFSRIDGMSTVEDILAMGGLDPFTTLRALSQLVRAGVIGIQAR